MCQTGKLLITTTRLSYGKWFYNQLRADARLAFINGNISGGNRNFVKTRANYGKKSSKFTKKITHVDDMMIHNLVKYVAQTRLRL